MRARRGVAFAFTLGLASLLAPLARPVLQRRLKRGKEHPDRWREKLGQSTVTRPIGRLIWLHAVGLGEVMALRGLIATLHAQNPDVHFLVTSTTRQSAEVFQKNLPPKTIHQFLPLDIPDYVGRFLDHWKPDMAIWSEQDLWPVACILADERGIPLVLVNGRMDDRAFASRRKLRGLYRRLYRLFRLISAQDDRTAQHLVSLGADGVRVDGSLKFAAPSLAVDPVELDRLRDVLAARFVWVAASTHPEDEAAAIAAHRQILQTQPDALLILAPRFVARGGEIANDLDAAGLDHAIRSLGQGPRDAPVYLADTVGELGLWYRVSQCALIGGGFGAVGGHNPWEAVHLNTPVFFGPNTANFKRDYAVLADMGAAIAVQSADDIAVQVDSADFAAIRLAQQRMVDQNAKALDKLAQDILAID